MVASHKPNDGNDDDDDGDDGDGDDKRQDHDCSTHHHAHIICQKQKQDGVQKRSQGFTIRWRRIAET